MSVDEFLEGTGLGQVLAYWRGLAPAGTLPRKQDLDAVNMPAAILPWLMIFQVDAARRGYCRLAGTGISSLMGEDPTGCNLSERVEAGTYLSWKPAADHCIATGRPAGVVGVVGLKGREWVCIRALMMPLSAGGGVDHILSMIVRDPAPVKGRSMTVLPFQLSDMPAAAARGS